jgi:hypothetical protein
MAAATTYSASVNLIPPTTSPWMEANGPLAFYTLTLLLISTALSQHAIVFE